MNHELIMNIDDDGDDDDDDDNDEWRQHIDSVWFPSWAFAKKLQNMIIQAGSYAKWIKMNTSTGFVSSNPRPSSTHPPKNPSISSKSDQILSSNSEDINSHLVGGFNPFEKYDRQNGNLPQIGVKIKNIWNHHPVIQQTPEPKANQVPSEQPWRLDISSSCFSLLMNEPSSRHFKTKCNTAISVWKLIWFGRLSWLSACQPSIYRNLPFLCFFCFISTGRWPAAADPSSLV